ncbi:MAG: class I SAM-dependent methyltransferase [Candidatus Pacearchaeota archaeon]|jgi:predicted SAM-dependent methyltransferase
MKNKNFFYLQYDKINWENQEKTKINYLVNNYIIKNIILNKKEKSIKLFDIGFGIGFFIKMLTNDLKKHYDNITIAGCEPSHKNYENFIRKSQFYEKTIKLITYNKTFQEVQIDEKFDFITAIYVFPHFASEDLEKVSQKIYSMLNKEGKFILVVADEKYLEEKLKSKKDLCIENNIVSFAGKKYKEVLHYSDIPEIGKLIDYNREESFYLDLFKKNKFELYQKKNLNDHGFICTIFVFKRK